MSETNRSGASPTLCALAELGSPFGVGRRTPFIQVKHGRALLRALAWQIARLGIRVLLGEPSWTRTEGPLG